MTDLEFHLAIGTVLILLLLGTAWLLGPTVGPIVLMSSALVILAVVCFMTIKE